MCATSNILEVKHMITRALNSKQDQTMDSWDFPAEQYKNISFQCDSKILGKLE
jgi:hypothetical protein